MGLDRIGVEQDLAPAAQCEAVDGGDDGLLDRLHGFRATAGRGRGVGAASALGRMQREGAGGQHGEKGAQGIAQFMPGTARERGLTILLVEENARSALKISHRGYVLDTGRMILTGTDEELRNNEEVKRAFLGKDYHEKWER